MGHRKHLPGPHPASKKRNWGEAYILIVNRHKRIRPVKMLLLNVSLRALILIGGGSGS